MKNELVLLEFYATWCEPCKWAEPVIKEVLSLLDETITLELIDVDLQKEQAMEFNVKSVPVFVLKFNEKEIWRMNGFDAAQKMAAAIHSAIDQNSKK